MTRPQWLAFAIFILALLIGALMPLPTVPEASPEADVWRPLPLELATAPPRPSATDGARWVTDAPAADAQGAEPWRLLGLSGRGEPVALFYVPETKQIRRIGVGDSLPDDARLTAIDGDGVTLERDGCRIELALHRERRSNAIGNCAKE